MIRLFESNAQAQFYSKYRSKPPAKIVEHTMCYLKERLPKNHPPLILPSCVVDVGCGTGQSTEVFAPHFQQSYGIDPSSNQIKSVQSIQPNTKFMVGKSDSLPFQNETGDLITCGQSVHWFDFDQFMRECRRVLKPSGCLALFGHGTTSIQPLGFSNTPPEIQAAEKAKQKFEKAVRTHERLHELDDRYCGIFKKLPSQQKIRIDNIELQKEWNLSDLKNLFRSWSGYQRYLQVTDDKLKKQSVENKPSNDVIKVQDPIETFSLEFKEAFKVPEKNDEEIKFGITWKWFLVLGERPNKA